MKGNQDIIWYQLSREDALQQAVSSLHGLSEEEILKRQVIFGKNIFPKAKTKSILSIFFSQFLNPLIYVLMAAAGVCIFIGEYQDAAFITAIIVINAFLGTYQEWRAESSAAALRNLIKVNARVKRDDKISTVDSEELVPGDIVLLESGMRVPADIRLFELHDFNVGEALLTGESQAVTKNTEAITVEHASPGDQLNMAFAGTNVEKGRAVGMVTTTGIRTEVGKIADSLSTTESERPPLLKRMDAFSKKISVIVVVICLVLGLVGWWRGMPQVEIFFFMIAVGVSAIPEGLPVALTVALAIGTRRMAKKNVIVRKLPAVEGLGSCTLIASLWISNP
jgi:magnesium-transporting ATPase (P-type)